MTAELTKELVPGESVVWSMQLGSREFVRARRGCLCTAAAILLIPCLPLLLFGNHTAWGLVSVLLLISVLLIFSTIRHYRKTYFQSAYAITNKRAIVLAGPQLADVRQTEAQVWSFYPDALRKRETVVYKDGTGDIVFWKRWFHTASDVDDSVAIAFVHIPDVEEVDGFLNALARQDTIQHTSTSEKELCRSVGRDHCLIWTDRPMEASKRYSITAVSLMGVAFLIGGIYSWGCALNWWSTDTDISGFDRLIPATLGTALPIGTLVCFLFVLGWNKQVEKTAQPSAAPLPPAPPGPSAGAR